MHVTSANLPKYCSPGILETVHAVEKWSMLVKIVRAGENDSLMGSDKLCIINCEIVKLRS